MGTAGISLTRCTMSPKSLIFLELTERKLIVQTVICHFEDYPGSPVTLRALNVLFAILMGAQIPAWHEDQGGIRRVARGVDWPREERALGMSAPSLLPALPGDGSRALPQPAGGQRRARNFCNRGEIKHKQQLLNHNFVFNLTVSLFVFFFFKKEIATVKV